MRQLTGGTAFHLRSMGTGGRLECHGQRAVLLTEAIEVGAQGIVGKVLFPQAWREELDLKGGVGIDALENIDKIEVRIDAL